MKRKSILRRVLTGFVAMTMTSVALIGFTAAPANAAFGGGEVNNFSGWSIRISNCWDEDFGDYQDGDLSCDGVGPYVFYDDNSKPAYRHLPPHTKSRSLTNYCAGETNNRCWYDVDSVQVPAGCHFMLSGEPWLWAPDHAPRWWKISNIETIEFEGVEC